MRFLVGVLVVTVLIAFYFICWRLNRKQKLPEGVKASSKKCAECGHNSCATHPNNRGAEKNG